MIMQEMMIRSSAPGYFPIQVSNLPDCAIHVTLFLCSDTGRYVHDR